MIDSDKVDGTFTRHLTCLSAELLRVLRAELLRLADHEDDRAATEAATVPYWAPCSPSVIGHRTAATVLRENAVTLDLVARAKA